MTILPTSAQTHQQCYDQPWQSGCDEHLADALTDGQTYLTSPKQAVHITLADGLFDPNTMRGMGLVPVNPQKVTSMVGHGPAKEDEFGITQVTRDVRAQNDGRKDDDQYLGHTSYVGGSNHLGNRGRPD